jgi:hypothetical protein
MDEHLQEKRVGEFQDESRRVIFQDSEMIDAMIAMRVDTRHLGGWRDTCNGDA